MAGCGTGRQRRRLTPVGVGGSAGVGPGRAWAGWCHTLMMREGCSPSARKTWTELSPGTKS